MKITFNAWGHVCISLGMFVCKLELLIGKLFESKMPSDCWIFIGNGVIISFGCAAIEFIHPWEIFGSRTFISFNLKSERK